ncbi:hypothetical protein J6590_064587 [Homalodisca vitripennis]|nr:hypothetical protein J6590_064587 [Homalodisca vitripennis]
MTTTSGAAKCSILGPDLWKIMYISVLRTIGVINWMADHSLSLALPMREIVILTKKMLEKVAPLEPSRRLDFRSATKAAKNVQSLNQLMANVGGLSPFFCTELRNDEYPFRLGREKRLAVLRVSATVSELAILLTTEERRKWSTRVGVTTTIKKKNELAPEITQTWEHESQRRWTARLIPHVQPRVKRRTRIVNCNVWGRPSHRTIYCPGIPNDVEDTFSAA